MLFDYKGLFLKPRSGPFLYLEARDPYSNDGHWRPNPKSLGRIWTSRFASRFQKKTTLRRQRGKLRVCAHKSHNLTARQAHLLARSQVLQRELSRANLVLADNQRKARAGLARCLQRLLETEALIPHGAYDPLLPHSPPQNRSMDVHARS